MIHRKGGNRNSNQDSNAFDNPGRWLRRILRQKGAKRNQGDKDDADPNGAGGCGADVDDEGGGGR